MKQLGESGVLSLVSDKQLGEGGYFVCLVKLGTEFKALCMLGKLFYHLDRKQSRVGARWHRDGVTHS